MINARNLLSAILLLAVTGLPVYGRSSSSVSAAAADTTIGYSSDTVFKASGDTVVKHRYLTRIKKTGDTVVRRNNFFRRFYHYFESANEDKTLTKKFDFSIIGGPHYSSDTKLGLGLVAAGLYRTGKGDTLTPPSNVSLFGDITTTGFYLLGVRGNTLFEQSKYRLDFTAYFFSFPGAFWGIGYRDATYNQAESYKRLQNQIKVDFMFRVSKNFYLGVSPSFNYIEGRDFSNIDYLRGQKTRYINTGLAAFLLYDSRDFIPNAWRGIYVKLEQRIFPGFFGNDGAFSRTEFQGNAYHRVWKGGVLAYDLHAMFNYGNTPWTMLSLLGGSYRMRGYYEGRYRDKKMIEAQVELRQKVYGRSGIAVWIGAGNVFPSIQRFNWKHTLPNYGIGYRWEFKKRMNVRLDYGFGKKYQNGFLFSINEAF
ncbi:BamA/TamA family outer membrane protein [Alistipes ihumii]|uniref:BamA/TamA family outer membrane protein n=1 Tax=Alistipes ihumii TaxID=1470347 RepID=UPI002353FFF8|nr:BamA/TamA family outer membrane protein [Alistipes ihumii]